MLPHEDGGVLHLTDQWICSLQVCLDVCTPIERFAFLVAALCHDLEHNGLNNAFHSNSMSKLALRYNDKNVLENHHCATAFEILLDKEVGFMDVLSTEGKKVFRRIVVETILCKTRINQGFTWGWHTRTGKREGINPLLSLFAL
eukprot:TRINITY_DN12015_c0_g1_i2.p2 TRINITY_DN12015_c0_g1~~TRINITY_DN12015_c0_g1_i2.p2  ORF type:complete len:144 (+),score=29.25 TRINITY_DN12015_c0_g1_i2:1127-1558(+)